MGILSWLGNHLSRGSQPPAGRSAAPRFQPRLEALEDRLLLSFKLSAVYPVGTDPKAVIAADVSGDKKLDLIVANGGSNDVTVWLGKGGGQGAFASTATYPVGTGPGSLVTGDF